MTVRDPKTNLHSSLVSLLLTSSLVGGAVACSFSEAPSVTQVLPTLSAQVPETPASPPSSIAFYYDGVKTSVTIKDAAVLFAACTLNTGDSTKIVNFVNNTLKLQPPITPADVTGLGDPLKPAISDFTGDGVVNCNDAAMLFAAVTVGTDAAKINQFVSNTLKIPGINVTQTQLDSFFKPTPTPSPTPTPTPTPAAQFYIHPTLGNDTNLGTSPLQPFKTVKQALTSTAVQTAASLGGGTNVIVTILDDGPETLAANVTSLALTSGSVTVVPDSGVNFILNLNNKTLTLNKGYKLQGFQIISGDPATNTTAAAAITLSAGGAPLKDMTINCTGITTSGGGVVGAGDKCVHVPNTVSDTVILDNVDISIPSNEDFVTGILHKGTGTLKVINGSSVVAAGSGNAKGVVGIYGNTTFGSVEVSGSTASLSAITATGGNVFSILLSGPIASGKVEGGSSIQVREGNSSSEIAIGVCVNATGTVTVQGNTFTNTGAATNSIGICKAAGTATNISNTFTSFAAGKDFVAAPNCNCP